MNWSYLHSFNTRPFSATDVDAPNYKHLSASAHGGMSQAPGSQGNEGASTGAKSKGQGSRKEAIDRFATVIDAEAPRFAKQRRENYKAWE